MDSVDLQALSCSDCGHGFDFAPFRQHFRGLSRVWPSEVPLLRIPGRASYALHHADVTFDLRTRQTTIHRNGIEPWRVTVVDTGDRQMTGGVKRAMPYVDNQTFCMTYGDGVADIDITAAIAFLRQHGKKATMTAAQPEGRFGTFALGADQNLVSSFHEKPKGDGAWINGGFFVLEPSVVDYIEGDDTVWEHQPLQLLAEKGELAAYRHGNFRMPMDTLRDITFSRSCGTVARRPGSAGERSRATAMRTERRR